METFTKIRELSRNIKELSAVQDKAEQTRTIITSDDLKKISAELLDTIKNRIVDAIRPEKIILFGSHAWGIPGDDSDIDLYIVVAKSDQPAYKKAREVYRALRGVNVPIDVIIQSHDEAARSQRVATSLGKKVAEEGVVLYG